MTRASFFALLFALIDPATANAQPADLVTVAAQAARLRPGQTKKVVVSINVKEGYHIQAHNPGDASLVPTTLVVDGSNNIITVRSKFPKAKRFRLEGTDTFLKVYDGVFVVDLFLTPAAACQPGTFDLPATLQYQACDSRTCLFPRTFEFSIVVEVVK